MKRHEILLKYIQIQDVSVKTGFTSNTKRDVMPNDSTEDLYYTNDSTEDLYYTNDSTEDL